MPNEVKPLEFSNPELNKKYVINAKADHKLIAPEGYSGPLTGAPEAVVEGLIRRGSNLVALKPASGSSKN